MEYETGGVLVGYYNTHHTTAVITRVTNAPKDSVCNRMSFNRGIKGLKEYLFTLWKEKNEYYLGEWHSHPHASANPSNIDINQIKLIAKDSKFNCSEPLLLVIGERNEEIEINLSIVVDDRQYQLRQDEGFA